MFVSKLRLQNFKRFTDLTIDLSMAQPVPKLVLMIGANGSGKSCVFDAFESCSFGSFVTKLHKKRAAPDPFTKTELYDYYQKTEQPALAELSFSSGIQIISTDGETLSPAQDPKNFYGRSALRQIPKLTRTTRTAQEGIIAANADRPSNYIEFDQRFENDLDIQTNRLVRDIFDQQSYATKEIRDKYVAPINNALARVFKGDKAVALELHAIIPALNGLPPDMRFRKGQSEIHYDLLSSGEKEVLNLLFNLHTRRQFYDDTIYFIDELDVHLNTALQYNLLKEITENWLPENCQLWTASHSLGFIQYAREAAHAAILDFDQFDFDQPHVLKPQPKESLDVYEIAVPAAVLPQLFKDKRVILCENQNDQLFNLLGFDRQLFVGVRDKNEVYLRAKKSPQLHGLMDRDYLSETEIANLREPLPNLLVLGYYTFENYLYHPDNIRAAVPDFDAAAYRAEITRQKNKKRDAVLLGLNQTRGGYAVLKNEEKVKDEFAPQQIAQALASDDFETFYPYFNMKQGNFSHQMLETLNLPKTRLAQTAWFRATIGALLELKPELKPELKEEA